MSDTDKIRDNDMIADYVRLRCPGLLETIDFNLYKLSYACRSFCESFSNAFKGVDLKKLVDLADEFNERSNSIDDD